MSRPARLPRELELLAPFVLPARMPELRAKIRQRDGRRRLRAELGVFPYFDPRWRRPIPLGCLHAAGIGLLLRLEGAPEQCQVFSENPNWEGDSVPLPRILDRVLWSGLGTLVVCRPGQLAYYEGAEPDGRCLLVRPVATSTGVTARSGLTPLHRDISLTEQPLSDGLGVASLTRIASA